MSDARLFLWGLLGCIIFGCAPELTGDMAEKKIESRLGKQTRHICFWGNGNGHERLGETEARYVTGPTRFPGEPERCFEHLREAGVIRAHNGLDFELGEDAYLVPMEMSRETGVSVAFPCGVAEITDFSTPIVYGDRATVSLSLTQKSVENFVKHIPAGTCLGRTIPVSAACDAIFSRRGSDWTLDHFEGDACQLLNR